MPAGIFLCFQTISVLAGDGLSFTLD